MEPAPTAINCRQCAHYYITHDLILPYGCRALGFKSRIQPCLEVLAASGAQCQYFNARQHSTLRRER